MKEWSEIMQEVDRIYHANSTSEGRIACITDYVVREIRAAPKSVQPTSGFCPDHPDVEFVVYCPVEGCHQPTASG